MNPQKKIRPLLEIAVELSAIFFYIWFLEVRAPVWVRTAFFWSVCVGFPLLCIKLEQREFPEFDLGIDAFRECFRWLFHFTLIATAFLVCLALYYKSFTYDGQFLGRLSEYMLWAFLQQIGFQIFLTYRIQKILVNPYLTAFASALLFALIHFPNWSLVSFTFVGGFFWALSYQKTPNLYLLAVSHAWLAVVALYCVPVQWMHSLRIGPTYWKF